MDKLESIMAMDAKMKEEDKMNVTRDIEFKIKTYRRKSSFFPADISEMVKKQTLRPPK